ncbi:MAG: aminotransferase class III-fold pyridoxal phosphate-dependent enzyme, partial [Myxococcota bacterium]
MSESLPKKLPKSQALLQRLYQDDLIPADKKPIVIDPARCCGPYLVSVDEPPFALLDAASQIASAGLGFSPTVLQQALKQGEMTELLAANPNLCYMQDSAHNQAMAHLPAIARAKKILQSYGQLLLQQAWNGLEHVSFTASGAEANEKAFDLCRQHGPGGKRIIAFEGAFHGRTWMALQATHNPHKRGPFVLQDDQARFMPWPRWTTPGRQPPIPTNWIKQWHRAHVPSPTNNDPLLQAEIDVLTQLKRAIEQEEICAVIVEPMQGEGGDNYATARFFNGLRALTRGAGVPLIFDEVQTGLGLGGACYWHTQFNLRDADGNPDGPDCVTLAKRAQLGVCLSAWPDSRPSNPHMLQALRGFLMAQQLLQHDATPLAQEACKQLLQLAKQFPKLVQRPRGQGHAWAFDLPNSQLTQAVIDRRFARGFMTYKAGEHTVRFRLNAGMTTQHVQQLFECVGNALHDVAANTQSSHAHSFVQAPTPTVPMTFSNTNSGGQQDSKILLDASQGVQAPCGLQPLDILHAVQAGSFTGPALNKLTLSSWATPTVVRYTDLLRRVMPKACKHLYVTSSRDETVDKGLRCLRLKRPQAHIVIGFTHQYVGHTTAAARSLS